MQRTFEDGEIIFNEGDEGDCAFVIQSGAVTLDKRGANGPVHIAELRRGELLGEMGALDRSPRSATATAVGQTVLHAIAREEFLRLVTTDPDMALRVMTKLVERLRVADERLAMYEGAHLPVRSVAEPATAPKAAAKPRADGEEKETDGLLSKIFGLGRKKPPAERGKPAASKAKPEKKAPPKPARALRVAVHPVAGDENGALGRILIDGLRKIEGLDLSALRAPLSTTPEPDFESVMAVQTRAGRAWLQKREADLMIVGGLEPSGRLLELRLIAADPEPGDRLAAAPIATAFYIPPADGDQPIAPFWRDLFAAAVAAALPARSIAQMNALLQITQGIGGGLAGLPEMDAPSFTPPERAAALIHGANVLGAAAMLGGGPASLETAIDLNRAALRLLSEDENQEWGDAQRQLALTLLALSERNDDAELLDRAAESLRAALRRVSRERLPWTWGRLQNRLGQALYRLDLVKVSEQALKESVNAFQMALQVLDRERDATTWAETMNNLSQSLQLYGEHTGNGVVIARAVDSARAALERCSADDAPFLWAAAQNNLGAALFLWGKHGGGLDKFESAETAFAAALQVYRDGNSPRMAEISEKNLRRAQSQVRVTRSGGGDVAEPDWATVDDPADEAAAENETGAV